MKKQFLTLFLLLNLSAIFSVKGEGGNVANPVQSTQPEMEDAVGDVVSELDKNVQNLSANLQGVEDKITSLSAQIAQLAQSLSSQVPGSSEQGGLSNQPSDSQPQQPAMNNNSNSQPPRSDGSGGN